MSKSAILSSDSGFGSDHSVLTTSAHLSTKGTSISSKSTHSPAESRLLRSNAEDSNKSQGSRKPRTPDTIPPDPDDIEKSVPAQILLKMKEHIPRLLQSFCIVNMQHHTKPVVALSEDLLPNDSSSMQGLPDSTNGEYFGQTWTIQSKKIGGRQAYRLVVSGDLIDPTSSSLAATQCFFAILQLTPLIDAVRYSQDNVWRLEGPEPDIWYAIYLEDMDAAGEKVRYRPPKQEVKKVSRKEQLDIAEDMIRLIHKDYFVLRPSSVASGICEIAAVSPSLLATPPPDLSSLSYLLTKGQQFRCEIVWGTVRTLYCIPMADREVDCWLCFLLEKDLPDVW